MSDTNCHTMFADLSNSDNKQERAMANCELMETCIFFNDKMASMPATAEVFKKMYCRGDSSDCARMIVVKALGRQNVPADMMPSDVTKAKTMIGAK